jgi:hypothetical protein
MWQCWDSAAAINATSGFHAKWLGEAAPKVSHLAA